MLISEIWKVINDYGTSSLTDKLSSTAATYLPNSFYVKVFRFLETLENENDSPELTPGEAYEFVKCVFTTERDKLYGIEKKLYDDIAGIIPYHWSAAARILLRNDMMREDFWLLCSQNGNRGLSYVEILPVLDALATTNQYVINFLQRSNFFFDAVAHAAALTQDNLRQSLLQHKNVFGIVLFTFKTQYILEDLLKQPDAEDKILNQMILRINALGPQMYEVIRYWNREDLQNFAHRAPGGPGMFKLHLPGEPRETSPLPNARLEISKSISK